MTDEEILNYQSQINTNSRETMQDKLRNTKSTTRMYNRIML